MQQSTSFLKAKQQFDTWRKTKASGEKVPDALWGVLGKLLSDPSNKRSVVAKALGIGTSQLKREFPEYYPHYKQPTKSRESKIFVKASLAPLIHSATQMPGITIERHNGIKLTVCAPTNEQFSTLLKFFMEP